MKIVRLILSVIGLFVLVCVLAISALVIFINPNKLKPAIVAEIKQHTGYDIVIQGDFSWSFYPSIGIKVERISLYVPTQPKPFLDLHDVTFVTEIGQLLHGNQKLRGDIYIADVNLLNIHAQKAHIGLHWQNQLLTLQPITAALYSGTLKGTAQGKNLSAISAWDWDMQLADIQLQPLLQDINAAGSQLKISGTGQIHLHVSTQGQTREQLLNSLMGTSEFSLKNGIVEGIDLNYLVRSADAILNKQPLVVPANISQTSFDSLTATTIIKNGVIATTDLILTAPALTVSGAGSINLLLQAINLQLRIAPQKEAKTQWLVPVLVTGNLYSPDVRLDATELNIMVAKEKLETVKVKVRDEIKRHLSGKANQLLQGILGK